MNTFLTTPRSLLRTLALLFALGASMSSAHAVCTGDNAPGQHGEHPCYPAGTSR